MSKPITAKQQRLYLIQWAKVKKLLMSCKEIRNHAEAEAKRHAIHVEALGVDKSSKLFTNADLDRVLDAFQTYLGLADPRVSQKAVEEPRKRALYAIDKLGFPPAYILKVAVDKFGTVNGCAWRDKLGESELNLLKLTLTMRARSMKKQGRVFHDQEPQSSRTAEPQSSRTSEPQPAEALTSEALIPEALTPEALTSGPLPLSDGVPSTPT